MKITLLLCLMLLTPPFGKKFQKLLSQAEGGEAASQYQVALRYEKGRGVKRNQDQALAWYRRSAEQGYLPAQVDLGWILLLGEGVPVQTEEAIKWNCSASRAGSAQAIFNLAWMYDMALGVAEDDTKAVYYYQLAAERNHCRAMLNLAVMYAGGQGVTKNLVTAYQWLEAARIKAQDKDVKWRARSVLPELTAMMTQAEIEQGKQQYQQLVFLDSAPDQLPECPNRK